MTDIEEGFRSRMQTYTLVNKNGLSVTMMNYGSIIHSILVPDRNCEFDDIVLGFKNLSDYEQNPAYFGAIIGRVANRIAKGKFSIDGELFELPCNENSTNHLHGGFNGFNKFFWDAIEVEEGNSISFSLRSPDGDQGYPGELDVTAHFVLNDENELRITYKASVKDKPTIINLTSHPYFNLSGVQKKCHDINDHVLEINANAYLPKDANQVPTGEKRHVGEDDGVFDFSQPKLLGNALDKVPGNRYDCTFSKGHKETFAARLYHPGSGRVLEVFSSQPATHIYTPDYNCGTMLGKHGQAYQGRCGLAIENQNYPNAINLHFPPSPILRPGDLYEQFTTYKFSVK